MVLNATLRGEQDSRKCTWVAPVTPVEFTEVEVPDEDMVLKILLRNGW